MKFTNPILGFLIAATILFPLPAFGMQFCDYDTDEDVDGKDLFEFSEYFADQHPDADLDGSGIVDIQDLSICSREFGYRVEDIKPAVRVANLKDQTAVKTGFIIGSANILGSASDIHKIVIVVSRGGAT